MEKKEKGKQITYITLFDGYAVAVDNYSYAAARKNGVNKKTGETIYRPFGFYNKMGSALLAIKKDYARRAIQSSEVLTLDDAISVIVRSNNRFESYLKQCFEGITT